jgi:hypothetical protein
LPVLHEGLRTQAKEINLKALGISENVTITLGAGKSTDAIKVLCEHTRGLTVALSIPFKKKFLGGYEYGDLIVIQAKSEVDAWSNPLKH